MDFFRSFIGVPRFRRPPQWPPDRDEGENEMGPEKFMSSILEDQLNDILQHIFGIDASARFPIEEHHDPNQTLRDHYLKPAFGETPSQKCDSDVDGSFNVDDLGKIDSNVWPEVKQPTFHRRSVFSRTVINSDGRMETRTVVEEDKNGKKEVQITETTDDVPISSEACFDYNGGTLRKSMLQRFADFFMRQQT